MFMWTLRILLLLFSSFSVVAVATLNSSVDGRTACPGERVTYTCTVTQAAVLEWTAEPFINSIHRQQFSSTTPPEDRVLSCKNDPTSDVKCTDLDYYANLTRVSAIQNGFADMTSTFRFTASARVNGAVVQCKGLTATEDQITSQTLIVTGLPSPPRTPSSIVQQYGRDTMNLTVQWQPPHYDGGAPVNYTITVSPSLSPLTTSATSVPVIVPYNVMHTVSIVATNCNGSSSAAMETIRIANCSDPTAPKNGSVEVYQNTTEGAHIHFRCNPGFLPAGTTRTVCATNGRWNPDPGRVTCTVSPSINLYCVDLSKDVSGAVNVTVSWTLSGGDSADFYLISITTNARQAPYGGLLNITTGRVTQYELTGFMADYEYNITICGVNCGREEAGEDELLTITPQLPAVPSSCNITLSYDSHSPGRLQFINTSWDSVLNSVDPGEACPTTRVNITQYHISFQTGSVVATEIVNITRCTAGRCRHTFQPPSNPPSNYDRVSVAAENVVRMGPPRTCTTQPINTTNNILTGEVVDIDSPTNATINCVFLLEFSGYARCQVQYGTDPTYMNLPYLAESNKNGTAGDFVRVVLRERLNSSTKYYYTVSSVSGDLTVTVQANFTTPQYICILQLVTGWHITLNVMGVLALVVAIVVAIVMTMWMMITYCRNSGTVKLWQIALVVIVAIFCVIGVVLWIAVGVVVLNPPNRNVCDSHWHHSHDGLIISRFVFSVSPIIFALTLLLIYTLVKKNLHICCTKWNVKSKPKNPMGPDGSGAMQLQEDDIAEPQYDSIQDDPQPPGAVPNPSDLSYSYLTEVSTGLSYAELGPHIPPAAVAPPPIDNNVRYTSLLDDQNQSKQNTLIPIGPPPTIVTSPSQTPLDTEEHPPPIPPQQFSHEDILLLPKLSESMELQEDGRDTPPPLPPKINEEDVDLPPLPPKMNEEDMDLPPLPPKTDLEETTVPPLPPKTKEKDGVSSPYSAKTNKKAATLPTPPTVNQEDALSLCSPKAKQDDATLLSHFAKKNQEGTALPQHPTEQITEEEKEEKGPVAVSP